MLCTMKQMPARFAASIGALVAASLGLAAASPAAADPISPPPAPLCKVPSAGTKITAVFQPKVAVRDLATWFYGFTCKKVVFASELGDVSASVSVIGDGAMTVKQATALFGNALTAAGLKWAVKGDTWIVTRDPKAPSCAAAAAPSLTPEDILAIGAAPDETRKANGIVAVDETHFTIKRDSFNKLFADPTQLSKGARVVPSMRDGKAEGFKLYAIRASSIFAALGFLNGDTLATIDGTAMTSADVALTKYTELRKAKHLEVGVLRRGKSVTLVYDIVD